MALNIAGGVRARLIADDTLTAMLATYEGGPAIVGDPVPDDLETEEAPFIVISAPLSDEQTDDYTTARREARVTVRLYAKHNGSTINLNAAAERVRALLKFWDTSSFSTGELECAFVSGPTPAPTDDPSIEGRALSAKLMIKE